MAPRNRNRTDRAASSDATYTTSDFLQDFPDDATCLDWLWCRLYSPDGKRAMCPKCKQERTFHRVKSRPSYSCDTCGHHIHPTAGTIFHKSSTPLQWWFHAVFLMSQTRCGISAKQLERELGVTYKTAWRMFNRIRKLLQEDGDPLDGEVEIDETYVGGKARYMHRDKRREKLGDVKGGRPRAGSHKTPVVGMAQRGGKVVAVTVPNVKRATTPPARQAPRLVKSGCLHRRISDL